MRLSIPNEAKHIITNLARAGYSAYMVGGCVRDSLMGLMPKDWDIATSAEPTAIKRLFTHTVDTGIKHGTVTVVINRCNYEVTTFRIDGEYQDGRRPESVAFTNSIEDDLSRRDFTMNAIAYNHQSGLVDPFGGAEDIAKKNIRCVGNAEHRFTEDALRMMRALRFAAQLGFSIDPNTISAIPPLAERLGLVSIERVRDELTKLMSSANPHVLPLVEESGLWPYVLRGMTFSGKLDKIAMMLETCPKEPAMLYALLLKEEKKSVGAFLRHLRFDNNTINKTVLYVNWLDVPIPNDRYAIKKALADMGMESFVNLLTLKSIIYPFYPISPTAPQESWDRQRATAENILKYGECFTLKELDISGQDLIEAGILPGKEMGQIMANLLDMVMQYPCLNKKAFLLQYACELHSV